LPPAQSLGAFSFLRRVDAWIVLTVEIIIARSGATFYIFGQCRTDFDLKIPILLPVEQQGWIL
jgi:hypothetical protein